MPLPDIRLTRFLTYALYPERDKGVILNRNRLLLPGAPLKMVCQFFQ
jgi:hypothetical protein